MRAPDEKTMLLRLRTAVEHLSWPASRQREYLTDLGVAPLADELALEFDDALRPAQATPGLTGAARETLVALDRVLAGTGPASSGWHVDDLAESAMWAEARRLAARALTELPPG